MECLTSSGGVKGEEGERHDIKVILVNRRLKTVSGVVNSAFSALFHNITALYSLLGLARVFLESKRLIQCWIHGNNYFDLP